MKKLILAALAAVTLTGCSNAVEGTAVPTRLGIFLSTVEREMDLGTVKGDGSGLVRVAENTCTTVESYVTSRVFFDAFVEGFAEGLTRNGVSGGVPKAERVVMLMLDYSCPSTASRVRSLV